MLLPDMRMSAPPPMANSPVPLFAIVVRSMLMVAFAPALTALSPLPEMIDWLTLTNTFASAATRPTDVEPVIVTFFSDTTLKPPELLIKIPPALSLITVSSMNTDPVNDTPGYTYMPVPSKLPRKLLMEHFSICTSLADWI